ncbi:cyclin-J-like protein [Halyomorpha halys]|uniref:cyclin-J-like protein n=1 Tax=Halyomorpha halys TaxID=286706 RepID=UPI0006D4EBD5|nr:cyclin-J-like protein [Halyomorpha halys]XP_014279938.1 cyclin-J-like protein [Halyomorpha halys]
MSSNNCRRIPFSFVIIMLGGKKNFKSGLFCWCLSAYASDIHSYLKKKERNVPRIHFRSPQLKFRPGLIDWIRSLSVKMKLSTLTVHLGVRLIDVFMDSHNIKQNRLPAICLICLLIAAKFEEEDSMIPKLKDLPTFVNDETTKDDFLYLEFYVLESLNWFVAFATAAHFAEYYFLFSVVNGDSNHFETSHRHLQDLVQSSMRDFLDISLTEVYMHEFLSSQVAAACLLAARLEHGVIPVWPKAIANVTGYTLSDLQGCLGLLIDANVNYSSKCFEGTHSESGYESCSPENLFKQRKLDIS